MDGRGGCCIARHMAGPYDMSKVDRIMLRFRPIAPKPTADGSVSTVPENKESRAKTSRGKRKYVRDSECNGKAAASGGFSGRRCSKKRKVGPASEEENESIGKAESGGSSVSSVEREAIVTLPLLPEKPEWKESPAMESTHSVTKKQPDQKDPIWLSFGNQPQKEIDSHVTGYVRGGSRGLAVLPPAVKVVGSWVRVECVTGTWINGHGLGRTDQERARNLERDTCPGFISDGQNRVRWANAAYRDLVGHSGGGSEVVVWVVMGDGVRLPSSAEAFTCRVRVVTCGKEKSSKILLCDVWRMDGGGFAWRLDTEAALSLGLSQ